MKRRPESIRTPSRPAFTLVEMLVSTGLVVLIMSMFAQIYGTSIQTITLQRGIGNNDQKARTVNTLLLGDLRSMTYRQAQEATGDARGLVPLAYGDTEANHGLDSARQQGYFYYSENDPDDDTDDSLQITVKIGSASTAGDITTDSSKVFLGRTGQLGGIIVNEPDEDDQLEGNEMGQSRAAEIMYFLRNGNLYRRVLLLRDPPYNSTAVPEQPVDSNGLPVFDASNTDLTGIQSFLGLFDYSATRAGDTGTGYFWLNGISSLNNSTSTAPLGMSRYRFGFDSNPSGAILGQPREYTTDGDYFGRFTMEETSNDTFIWPSSAPSPFPISSANLNSLSGGDRNGEDLLLTNVEAMDIKAYDPADNTFVDLGRGTTWSAATNNPGYSSGGSFQNIFDTWHPENLSGSVSGSPSRSSPPHLPRKVSTFTVDVATPPATSWSSPDSPPVGSFYQPTDSTAIIYKVIENTGVTGTNPPNWDYIPGSIETDGGITWQCVDNRIGLKAIQITIRYRDPSKQLPKQITLVHSFVE
ncbi:PilW family protein [Planctomicrobium sp. SH661]|uniref:PilW family protein n=1 Tax=Planctomicrobium sp. SH661 TaxID=3448124 RepID=UPI003F5C2034